MFLMVLWAIIIIIPLIIPDNLDFTVFTKQHLKLYLVTILLLPLLKLLLPLLPLLPVLLLDYSPLLLSAASHILQNTILVPLLTKII
jgi:hypothetical protein